jgi:DNA-binding NtrC family response regulator
MNEYKKRPLQIMFVENDRHVRDSLKVFFKNSDIGYLIFKSAAEGLNALKFQNMDVVISDYFLPDMDGVTFLKKVGELYPNIKRILMATITSDDMKLEITKAGIDRFIEKPLSIDSLELIINELETVRSSK